MRIYNVDRKTAYGILTNKIARPAPPKAVKVVAPLLDDEAIRAAALAYEMLEAQKAADEAADKEAVAEDLGDGAAADEAAVERETAEEKVAEKKAERKEVLKKAKKKKGKNPASAGAVDEEEDLEALLAQMKEVDAAGEAARLAKKAEDEKALTIVNKKRHASNARAEAARLKGLLEEYDYALKKNKEIMWQSGFTIVALSRAEALEKMADVQRNMERHLKIAADLEKEVKELTGKGRHHKAFPYSRPDLTPDEKAKERAKHYRDVKKEITYGRIKGEVRDRPEHDDAGLEDTVVYARRNPAAGPTVTWGSDKLFEMREFTPATKAGLEAQVKARGVLPKKEKTPKKDSERKPYVGSKMKEQLFMASPHEQFESKEFKALLRRASKMYKEGDVSWEEVIRRVLAP